MTGRLKGPITLRDGDVEAARIDLLIKVLP